MLCEKCGQESETNICPTCSSAQKSRNNYLRQHQTNWLEVAEESGIDPWLQQPGETQWEYTVWCAFRDAYPGKRPTYNDVAVQLDCTPKAVQHISQRWTFTVRMQLWMKHVDDITLQQRRQEILDMNAVHIGMATKLNEKLARAIDLVEPEILKPGELVALAKLATELERKARVDSVAQEVIMRDAAAPLAAAAEIDAKKTKTGDLAEVIQILQKSGALGDIGIKQTTELVVRRPDED